MIRVLEFANIINRYDFIDNLVNFADPAEFEMSVCVRSEDADIARPLFPENTKYRLLPGNSRRDSLQTAWKLSKILREWQIDVIHTHHFEQAIIGWLATKIYPKTKLLIGRHYSDAIYRLPKSIKQTGLLKLEQIINRHAARIIVPSQYIFDLLTKRQNIEAEKIDVVLYGFVPEKYHLPDADQIESVRSEFKMDGRFVVANFSRLHEEKGHCYLVEAVAKLREKIPNLLVLCVGEGGERQNIERRIKNSGVAENIKLVGWRRDAMTIMAAADAVAQSTLQEAFSQVMVESLWMSKPLIITDVSGAPDIIQNEVNGLLIPKADVEALAEALEKLFKNNRLREKIINNGRRFVEENLVIDKKIREYEQSFLKASGVQKQRGA